MGFGGEGGSVVVSGSFDATVRLWDCKSQNTKPIQVLEEAKDSVSSLHVVGHEIVTGSVDGRIRIYDLRMGMIYTDVIGRMYSPHCRRLCERLGIDECTQNLLPPSNRPATATQSSYRPSTPRLG